MALNLRTISLEPIILETSWTGDLSIDLPRCNILQWSKTGDPAFLAAKPGEALSVIKYRGLTDAEMALLPPPIDGETIHPLFFRTATQYGLIEISDPPSNEPLRLDRTISRTGIKRISDREMLRLDCLKGPVAWLETMEAIVLARDPETGLDERGEGEAAIMEVSLPFWLGAHILAATFRSRKHVL